MLILEDCVCLTLVLMLLQLVIDRVGGTSLLCCVVGQSKFVRYKAKEQFHTPLEGISRHYVIPDLLWQATEELVFISQNWPFQMSKTALGRDG